jgi:hypothetical protein
MKADVHLSRTNIIKILRDQGWPLPEDESLIVVSFWCTGAGAAPPWELTTSGDVIEKHIVDGDDVIVTEFEMDDDAVRRMLNK